MEEGERNRFYRWLRAYERETAEIGRLSEGLGEDIVEEALDDVSLEGVGLGDNAAEDDYDDEAAAEGEEDGFYQETVATEITEGIPSATAKPT